MLLFLKRKIVCKLKSCNKRLNSLPNPSHHYQKYKLPTDPPVEIADSSPNIFGIHLQYCQSGKSGCSNHLFYGCNKNTNVK